MMVSFGLRAQHPAFYQLSTDAGMPSNEVYCMVQDSFGYNWLGTDAGIVKYDGNTFTTFKNAGQNARASSFLQVDSKQRVWGKNFYGQIYRIENDSLHIILQFNTSEPGYPHFALDSGCNVWVYSDKSITKYSELGDSLLTYTYPQLLAPICGVQFFGGKLFVFCSDLSGYSIDICNGDILSLRNSSVEKTKGATVMPLVHNDRLILLCEFAFNGNSKFVLYEVSGTELRLFHEIVLPDKNDRVYSIYSDEKLLWLTSSFGVWNLGPDNNSPSRPLFEEQKVSGMVRDREGSYWFTTLHSGIYFVPSLEVINVYDKSNILQENAVTQVVTTGNATVLFGTYLGNLFSYNSTDHLVESVYPAEGEFLRAPKSIQCDADYTFVSRGRFCVIDNATGRQFFPPISNVRDFARVGDSVFMVMPQVVMSTSIRCLTGGPYSQNLLYDKGGRVIQYDSVYRDLYFGFSDGTYIRDSIGQLTELTINGNPIYASDIVCRNGVTWIGTATDGVYGFINRELRYHFDQTNGLRGNSVRSLEVTDTYLWVNTDKDLVRITLSSSEAGYFNTAHLINPKDINCIHCSDGVVYLGTSEGLIYFPEKMEWRNSVVPNIRIDGIYSNGIRQVDLKQVVLPHERNVLRILFSSTAYKNKGKFLYEYRLMGGDSSWTSLSSSTPWVIFSHLSPGKYRFEVRSVNESGVYSRVEHVEFMVNTPYWQRWWFYGLLVIGGGALIAFVFVNRIKAINKRAELKSRIASSQLSALKAQMNPHFMFNTLNSIQDLVIHRDVKSSNVYLGKFSKLMRKILDASGSEVISLQEDLEILELYLELEKLRFGDEFVYIIKTDPQLNPDELVIPSMIIQPFVENAVKHGLLHKAGLKELRIEFRKTDSLICTVTDNGIGREKAAEIKNRSKERHRSFATGATRKRIDLLNQAGHGFGFEIIDLMNGGVAEGTQVIITIPLRTL